MTWDLREGLWALGLAVAALAFTSLVEYFWTKRAFRWARWLGRVSVRNPDIFLVLVVNACVAAWWYVAAPSGWLILFPVLTVASTIALLWTRRRLRPTEDLNEIDLLAQSQMHREALEGIVRSHELDMEVNRLGPCILPPGRSVYSATEDNDVRIERDKREFQLWEQEAERLLKSRASDGPLISTLVVTWNLPFEGDEPFERQAPRIESMSGLLELIRERATAAEERAIVTRFLIVDRKALNRGKRAYDKLRQRHVLEDGDRPYLKYRRFLEFVLTAFMLIKAGESWEPPEGYKLYLLDSSEADLARPLGTRQSDELLGNLTLKDIALFYRGRSLDPSAGECIAFQYARRFEKQEFLGLYVAYGTEVRDIANGQVVVGEKTPAADLVTEVAHEAWGRLSTLKAKGDHSYDRMVEKELINVHDLDLIAEAVDLWKSGGETFATVVEERLIQDLKARHCDGGQDASEMLPKARSADVGMLPGSMADQGEVSEDDDQAKRGFGGHTGS